MNKLKSGIVLYNSVQNILSLRPLFKTFKIKIALYSGETFLLTLSEEHRLRNGENRVLRRMVVPARDAAAVSLSRNFIFLTLCQIKPE
jgi:hypothetical protein